MCTATIIEHMFAHRPDAINRVWQATGARAGDEGGNGMCMDCVVNGGYAATRPP